MGNFARALHHLDMKDVKKKRLEEIAAQKLKEKKDREEKKIIQEISKKYKSDWKREIYEGMTTANAQTITVAPAEGDGTVTAVDVIDASSYSGTVTGMLGADAKSGNTGSVIRDSGSGSGQDGGFNVGGKYLSFQGDGYNVSGHAIRWAALAPIDSSRINSLSITAIVGNDSNGGEDPDATLEDLRVMYKTSSMSSFAFLNINPNGPNGATDSDVIIPLGASGNSGLNNYSVKIPEYARGKNTEFVLIQTVSSGTGFDNYGITDIKFQRTTPVNVVVPLDDPEAISFVRVGSDEGDPKKRKKKLNDQLAASDEYTSSVLGNEFPGQGSRVDGEDPFKSAPLTPDDVINASPIGKDEVGKSFADFQQGQKTVEVLKTPEQIKAQNDEYLVDLDNLLTQNDWEYTDPKIIEIADKILKTDPKNEDAYFYKLSAQYVAGDMEGVLKTTDLMVKNSPDDPVGYEMRSFIKAEEGDLAGAIEDLEKAIELDPESEYIAYNEMELADLKFQEAELETNNAVRDRMESEAGAIEAKAHEDYWNNADLIEQEQEELVEYEYVDDEQLLRDFQGFDNFYGNPRNPGRSDEVPSMLRAAQTYASQLEHTDKYDGDKYQAIINAAQSWEGTPTEWAKFYTDAYMSIVYPDGDSRVYNWLYDAAIEDAKGRGGVSVFGTPAGILGQYKLSKVDEMSPQKVVSEFKRLLEWWYNSTRDQDIIARSKSAKLNNLAPYLNALAKNLPDYYFETDSEEPINTLYDQMKALYDEEDPEKEIKTELRAQGYEKQYKDLMTAWDSADKFSKFITPLKNLSDALLGSKTAQNAKYENYKIAIAKSIMLNKPIRVNPDTIDPVLIKKLGDRITPNQILSYDEEQRFKKIQETSAKLAKEGKLDPTLVYDYDQPLATDGIPLIPIVSEPVPYADENIYEDEFGRVFTNDGSVANTTFQPDRGYHGFANAYVTDMMRKNPIAGRGQAQYQIVVPPDGTEPYLLYKDHAYHNVKSTDEGEVPGFMNQGAAGFVNWLGNTAHARSDGDANTGGMAGYPPNIRGDVITEFRIPIGDLSKQVQEAVYRHKMMTDNPELVQVLRDKFYTDDYIKTMKFPTGSNLPGANDPTGEKGKRLHNFYNNVILKRADQVKDFVTDNALELVLRGIGKLEEELPEGMSGLKNFAGNVGDMRTASNMLQKYDEYIQQTIYSSTYDPNDISEGGEKGYVPGFTNPDGSVVDDGNRVDLTDAITKRSRDFLTSLLSSEDVEKEVRKYVNNGKTILGKKNLEKFLDNLTSNRENLNFGLRNSIGGGTVVDIDEFLNGKLVLKKNYQFRHDQNIDENISVPRYSWWNEKPTAKQLALSVSRGTTPVASSKFKLAKNMTKLWDVSNDTWPDGAPGKYQALIAVVTMTAARQLLHPVQGPGQSFASAMNTAPTMPYKIQLDVSEKIMKILQGIEDTPDDPRSGIAGLDEPLVIDKDKKNNKKNNVKESTLFERLKQKQFFNPNDIKPTFPENPPPQLDPKTGMHPRYGKNANRYKKLDPISANAMPPTGDPETDAVVDKQRTKPKTFAKFKKKIKENFTAVPSGPTNSVSQTFQHVSGQTFSFSGIGGQETHPSTVTVFGETIPAPNYNQLAIAGYAKPIVMQKKDLENVNPKLDASQEFAQKVGADVMMNARVKTELSLEQKREAVKKYKNDLEEWNKKSEARAIENESRRKSNISKVKSFVRKFGENLDDIKGFQTFMKIAEEGKKLIVIHQNNVFRDYSDKFNVIVYEAKEGEIIKKITGSFGRFDGSKFDNPFTNRKSSGQATIMYDGIGSEVENKTFAIKELPSIPMPQPPEHMKKNLSKGWQPVTKEDEDIINKLNIFFGKSKISSLIPIKASADASGIMFASNLAIQLAKGDTTPITKSPGVGFDANATRVIHSAIKVALEQNKTSYTNDEQSWYDPKTGTGQVMNNAYTILENPIDNITRAALGKFTFKVTPKGIQVIDDYDITKVTAIGGVSNPITDFISRVVSGIGGFTDQFGQSYDTQQLANLITGIAMRRGAELGFDMVDTDGQTIQPIYSGEDAYADSTQLATPKGFNIPINYTMPTGITIKNLLNPRQYTQNKRGSGVQPKVPTDRTGYGYDTKGKLDSSGYGMDPNRDTETEARPIKSSKAVNRIKNMAKARRQSLSLDKPIVRRKKKRG